MGDISLLRFAIYLAAASGVPLLIAGAIGGTLSGRGFDSQHPMMKFISGVVQVCFFSLVCAGVLFAFCWVTQDSGSSNPDDCLDFGPRSGC